MVVAILKRALALKNCHFDGQKENYTFLGQKIPLGETLLHAKRKTNLNFKNGKIQP